MLADKPGPAPGSKFLPRRQMPVYLASSTSCSGCRAVTSSSGSWPVGLTDSLIASCAADPRRARQRDRAMVTTGKGYQRGHVPSQPRATDLPSFVVLQSNESVRGGGKPLTSSSSPTPHSPLPSRDDPPNVYVNNCTVGSGCTSKTPLQLRRERRGSGSEKTSSPEDVD